MIAHKPSHASSLPLRALRLSEDQKLERTFTFSGALLWLFRMRNRVK
jgi:hypothetical protein